MTDPTDRDKQCECFDCNAGAYAPQAGDALTASGNDVLRKALAELAEAEKAYRFTHDTQGDGSRLTGRAWDLMRRAGDKARTTLAKAMMGGEGA